MQSLQTAHMFRRASAAMRANQRAGQDGRRPLAFPWKRVMAKTNKVTWDSSSQFYGKNVELLGSTTT